MNIYIFIALLISMMCIIGGAYIVAIPLIALCLYLFTPSGKFQLLKLIARLSNGYVVVIKDYEGEAKLTIARIDAFGDMSCHSYWDAGIGFRLLLDGGTMKNGHSLERWRYALGQTPDYSKGWKKDGRDEH